MVSRLRSVFAPVGPAVLGLIVMLLSLGVLINQRESMLRAIRAPSAHVRVLDWKINIALCVVVHPEFFRITYSWLCIRLAARSFTGRLFALMIRH